MTGLLVLIGSGSVAAQGMGISTQGVTGGLTIPSARVLGNGNMALSYGNYREPKILPGETERNYSFGLGLAPNVELFGRYAEYTSPPPIPGGWVNGLRDLSLNVKAQWPFFPAHWPKLALGFNDVGGGAVNFPAAYVVASDQLGPLRWSAGYARGRPIRGNEANGYAFDGGFAGVEYLFSDTGLSALAEYDGQQKHVGVRFHSPEIPRLAGASIVLTAQRAYGATGRTGQNEDSNTFGISLIVPLTKKPDDLATGGIVAGFRALAAVDQGTDQESAPSPEHRLQALQRSLVTAGLERVQVGRLQNHWVVAYENNRYGQNEFDAIGIALGLASEHAPDGVQRIDVIMTKAGLPLYRVSVDVAAYRAFLRDGDGAAVRSGMVLERRPGGLVNEVQWLDPVPTPHSPVRVEIKPDARYTLATEVGDFDYSLAANVQAFVPLWRGAELYASQILRFANSTNFESGSVYDDTRHRNGLRVAALHQSFWLGQHAFVNLGLGRYRYDAHGVQGEATLFVPGRDDVARLRLGLYERLPDQTRQQQRQLSGTYRWVYSPATWVEAGLQQYSDGTRGPSLVLTRWFGNVGAHVFYRKGGVRQFGGLELSFPLTPRRGMAPGLVHLSGVQQTRLGLRTQITGGDITANTVMPDAVRDFQLDYNAELRQLNAGRLSRGDMAGELPRMREAFYLYARDLLPR